MPSLNTKDSPYSGVSRSFVSLSTRPRWPDCRRCGSSLAGRKKNVFWRTISGTDYEVTTFRCRCGCGRQVRRPI